MWTHRITLVSCAVVFAVALPQTAGSQSLCHDWSQRFGDAGVQEAYGIATDGTGNVVVTGKFQGNVDFGGGALTSEGGSDIFVAKFDAYGNHLWSQRFGD